jgi:hypothetical protein
MADEFTIESRTAEAIEVRCAHRVIATTCSN